MIREKGLYWIKILENSDWMITEWDGEKFIENRGHKVYPFSYEYEEKYIFEICENRIERHMD